MPSENIETAPRMSSATEASSSKDVKVVRPRVWRACEVCRKRKIKCDGQDPCSFCANNLKQCSFTRAQDHASLSRLRDNDTQSRLERLEDRLDKLIPLMETTHAWIAKVSKEPVDSGPSPPANSIYRSESSSLNPVQTPIGVPLNSGGGSQAHVGPSQSVNARANVRADGSMSDVARTEKETSNVTDERDDSASVNEQEEDGEEDKGVDEEPPQIRSWADRLAGQFARDSTGNMRYLGGAPTFVLSEAVDSVRQSHLTPESEDSPSSPADRPTVDHLYFRPNVLYRPLNGLPAPEAVEYPPMALSDALVQMYFGKIHHTFPIIDKADFLAKYEKAMDGIRLGRPSSDSHFLCVLFAVYASAASLTKKVFQDRAVFEFSSPKEYIGLEFYERALYMYWSGFRMMTIEHVTCMALLSACLAGWNTLSQSWVLAGQAVRGAQDLGLHRSPKTATLSPTAKEYRRKVWWCVYGLDKILSVSLGRPSGINDEDCDVELPSDQSCCGENESQMEPPGNNPMTGIISLLKIYTIAGQIETRAHNINFLKKYDNSADHPEVRDTVDKLDAMLDDWTDTLPNSIRYAANNPDQPNMFALCLLGHFTLYACTLNLHRPFMPDFNTSSQTHTFQSLQKCVDAARGCIRIGEEVKRLLPTSHHCQFCVQYLTISGVTLLRCLPYVSNAHQLIMDATHCRHLLVQLEDTWPGSKRCGALLQSLLDICKNKRAVTNVPRKNIPSVSSHTTDPKLKRRISQVQPHDNSSNPNAKYRKERSESANRVSSATIKKGPLTMEDTSPSMANAAVAPIPTQAFPSLSTQMLPHTMIPIEGAHQDLGWMSFSSNPFDYSHLASQAPFDLADEIGALLEQIQDPFAVDPEMADQWPVWGANEEP